MEFDHINLQAKERLKRYYLEADHARTIAALKLELPKPKLSFSSVAFLFFRALRFQARDSRGGENV